MLLKAQSNSSCMLPGLKAVLPPCHLMPPCGLRYMPKYEAAEALWPPRVMSEPASGRYALPGSSLRCFGAAGASPCQKPISCCAVLGCRASRSAGVGEGWANSCVASQHSMNSFSRQRQLAAAGKQRSHCRGRHCRRRCCSCRACSALARCCGRAAAAAGQRLQRGPAALELWPAHGGTDVEQEALEDRCQLGPVSASRPTARATTDGTSSRRMCSPTGSCCEREHVDEVLS